MFADENALPFVSSYFAACMNDQASKPAKRYMTARERRVQRKLKAGDGTSPQKVAALLDGEDGSDGKTSNASKRKSKKASNEAQSAEQLPMVRHFVA